MSWGHGRCGTVALSTYSVRVIAGEVVKVAAA
jgi:hypothetical protein